MPCIRRRFRTCGKLPEDAHAHMKTAAIFTARIVHDGKWFIAFSPEFLEGDGQGLTEEEALESLRESILVLLEDRREDARASLGSGEISL